MEQARALDLSPSLHRVLATLWERSGSPAALEVDADDLQYVEAALGSAVPDAILALLLARGQSIGEIAATTSLRESIRSSFETRVRADALICFDRWGEHPMSFAGYERTGDRGEPAIVIWDAKKWVPVPELGWSSVEAYVRGSFGTLPREDGRPALDLDSPASPASIVAFAPRIVVKPRRADRIVVHPKFGEGRVLREIEGRLEIDFGAAGIKTLLARFVTERE